MYAVKTPAARQPERSHSLAATEFTTPPRSTLRGRAHVDRQLQSRAPEPVAPVVVIHAVDPFKAHSGVWLDNTRDPMTRLRVSIGKNGRSIDLVRVLPGADENAPIRAKATFNLFWDGKKIILDAIGEDYGFTAQRGDAFLMQLAARVDAKDFLSWIGETGNVRATNISVNPPRGESTRDRENRLASVAAFQARCARHAAQAARESQGHELYMPHGTANADDIPRRLEEVRSGLLALSLPTDPAPVLSFHYVARELPAIDTATTDTTLTTATTTASTTTTAATSSEAPSTIDG